MRLPSRSVLWRLPLLTSAILTVIFAATGYFLEKSIAARATEGLEQEVSRSFQAYEALWQEHTKNLQKISSVISRMADVRAAFQTNDRATIEDTAGELWAHIASGNALLAVADGNGKTIAVVGEHPPFRTGDNLDFIRADTPTQPVQRTGFLQEKGRLFQMVTTPVYVDAAGGKALLDVLVTGFELDNDFLRSLKLASGGSDLIFNVQGKPLASTMENKADLQTLATLCSAQGTSRHAMRLQAGGTAYLALSRVLPSIIPGGGGELCIVRSLAGQQQALHELRQRILVLWLAGLIAAILCTYGVAQRIMGPVATLDRAASEIAKGNYHIRIKESTDDELGRLANTFNAMCTSLESARAELIRNERLTAVARLATFVVHDLRNPLASIYAGSEMLVDNDLPPRQVKRLAKNMYQASRGVMEILQELLSAARSEPHEVALCHLSDIVMTAWHGLTARRELTGVKFECSIPPSLELAVDRAPMERVFHNLFENALEAMDANGTITVSAEIAEEVVYLHIRDTGRGIHPDLRPSLFQPFATQGKTGGLGLGLALSRQTVLANGGDLWADFDCRSGSHFVMRLSLNSKERLKGSKQSEIRKAAFESFARSRIEAKTEMD